MNRDETFMAELVGRIKALGLDPGAAISSAPTARHLALLSSYRLNLHRGAAAVQKMIRFDLHGLLALGAQSTALDLLVVLRAFQSEFPSGGSAPGVTPIAKGRS